MGIKAQKIHQIFLSPYLLVQKFLPARLFHPARLLIFKVLSALLAYFTLLAYSEA